MVLSLKSLHKEIKIIKIFLVIFFIYFSLLLIIQTIYHNRLNDNVLIIYNKQKEVIDYANNFSMEYNKLIDKVNKLTNEINFINMNCNRGTFIDKNIFSNKDIVTL